MTFRIIRKLRIFFLFLVFLFEAISLYGKPYLKVNNVNTQEYPYIDVSVSVTNEEPLENLNESNFSLFENGWKVGYFRMKEADPASKSKRITLLIDSSKSLSAAAFKAQISAAGMLVNAMNPKDEVSVISFNDTAQAHCGFTNSREQLKLCLGGIRQSGKKTVLYDALYKALVLNTPKTERSFIILFTDGKEEKSVFSFKDLNEQIQKNKLPVFVVCAGKGGKINELAKISQLTGGEIYNTPDTDSIVKIYRLLASMMDGTYRLQYISQAVTGADFSGKNRSASPVHLEVRMEHGEIQDQDIIEFNLPAASFSMALRNAFADERFKIFLGSSFILIVIVILISHLTQYKKMGRVTGGSSGDAGMPYFESGREVFDTQTGPVVKKKITKGLVIKVGGKANKKEKQAEEETPLLLDKYFAYIIEKEGPHTGRTSKIKWNIVTIGHGNENTIVIDDPTVSYKHAKIVMTENRFYLYDMISETGVYLNGKKLLRPKELNDFDEISIGRTKLLFRMASR